MTLIFFSWHATIYLLFCLPSSILHTTHGFHSILLIQCPQWKTNTRTGLEIPCEKVVFLYFWAKKISRKKNWKSDSESIKERKELCLQINKLNYSKRNFLYKIKSRNKIEDFICRIYDLFLFSSRYNVHWFIILLEFFCNTIANVPTINCS